MENTARRARDMVPEGVDSTDETPWPARESNCWKRGEERRDKERPPACKVGTEEEDNDMEERD